MKCPCCHGAGGFVDDYGEFERPITSHDCGFYHWTGKTNWTGKTTIIRRIWWWIIVEASDE